MTSPYWYAASIVIGVIVTVQGVSLGNGIESLGGLFVTVVGAIYLAKRLSMSEEEAQGKD